MVWRLEWAPAATRDVEKRAEEIALDSPYHAARWVKGLLKSARVLRKFPRRGRKVPEAEDLEPEIRELVLGDYRLIYVVEEPLVLVVALVQVRRDLAALLAQQYSDD